MPTISTPPTSRDIRLDVISMNEWRVCDRRFASSDSRCVLGFIERRDFVYEVTAVRSPGTVATFGSLGTATLAFSAI